MNNDFTEESLIDHNLSDTNVCCPLSKDQIKQILNNQAIVERLKEAIKTGLPHNSFSGDCCDGTNNSLNEQLDKILGNRLHSNGDSN